MLTEIKYWKWNENLFQLVTKETFIFIQFNLMY